MRRAAGLDDSASDAVGPHETRAVRTAIQDINGSRRSLKPFIVDIPLGWEGRAFWPAAMMVFEKHPAERRAGVLLAWIWELSRDSATPCRRFWRATCAAFEGRRRRP